MERTNTPYFVDMAPKQTFSECWKEQNLHELFFMKSHDSQIHLSYLIGLGYLFFFGTIMDKPILYNTTVSCTEYDDKR
jgi:hypothetical protein